MSVSVVMASEAMQSSLCCLYWIAATLRSSQWRSGPSPLRDRIEQSVHEAALALVVECVRDIDIFGDDRGYGNVGPSDQLIGPGAQDGPHRPVEPLQRPA